MFGCEKSKLFLVFGFFLWVSFPLTQVQLALPAWNQVSIHVGSYYSNSSLFILLAGEELSLDNCCLKHALIYQLYRYGRINVSVTGTVLLPHFIGSKPEKAQAPRAQVPSLQGPRSTLSGTPGFSKGGEAVQLCCPGLGEG